MKFKRFHLSVNPNNYIYNIIRMKNKKKGRIAKFTTEVKKAILFRDKCCVICEAERGEVSMITDYHHVYFGSQAEYCDDRNDANKGIGLCYNCHYNIHHGNNGKNQLYRRFCIAYLIKLREVYEKLHIDEIKKFSDIVGELPEIKDLDLLFIEIQDKI